MHLGAHLGGLEPHGEQHMHDGAGGDAMAGLAGDLEQASFAIPSPANSSRIKLVVSTPCFGGQISVRFTNSLLKLQRWARMYDDLDLTVNFKDGDALITRARASLVSQFLD